MAGRDWAGGARPHRRGEPQGARRGGDRPDRGRQPGPRRRHPHPVRRGPFRNRWRASGRSVPRRPDPIQGPRLHGRRRADRLRHPCAEGLPVAGDVLPRRAVPGRRFRPPGPHQRPGVRHDRDHRAEVVPAGAQPVEHRPLDWRFLRRIRRRRSPRHGPGGARQRGGRVDPHPGERVRARRTQADARPVSQGPLVGEGWAGGTIDGAVTRSVRDAAAILDAISAPMPGEPYYAPPFARPLREEVGRDPGRLRIGFLDRTNSAHYLDHEECTAAVASTARLLESMGHVVDESAPAAMFEEEFSRHFVTIIAADTEQSFQAFEGAIGRAIADDEIEPRNVVYREVGKAMPVVTYLDSRAWLGLWARRMADWWQSYDVLLTPTLGAPPPPLGWFTEAGAEQEGQRIASFIPYTAQFNMTGQPAVSLPLHWSADGLPVGVQLVAAYGREDVLVRLAAQLEQAAPWADRRPPVHA